MYVCVGEGSKFSLSLLYYMSCIEKHIFLGVMVGVGVEVIVVVVIVVVVVVAVVV